MLVGVPGGYDSGVKTERIGMIFHSMTRSGSQPAEQYANREVWGMNSLQPRPGLWAIAREKLWERTRTR